MAKSLSNDWEDTFDTKFGVNSIYPVEVKQFIKELLAQARESERVSIAKNILDMKDRGFSDKGVLIGFYDWAKGVLASEGEE